MGSGLYNYLRQLTVIINLFDKYKQLFKIYVTIIIKYMLHLRLCFSKDVNVIYICVFVTFICVCFSKDVNVTYILP